MITDAATARAVMLDPGTWSSDRFDGPRPPEHDAWIAELAAEEPEIRRVARAQPAGLDRPRSARPQRLRNVLRRAFAPAAVEALRPLVRREVEALLPSDIDSFSRALPFRVVMRLARGPRAGVARARAARPRRQHRRHRDRGPRRVARPAAGRARRDALLPRPSTVARLRDDTISPREAAGLCREVLVAGSESVAILLAGALRAIAREGPPEDLERSSNTGSRSTHPSRPSGAARRAR